MNIKILDSRTYPEGISGLSRIALESHLYITGWSLYDFYKSYSDSSNDVLALLLYNDDPVCAVYYSYIRNGHYNALFYTKKKYRNKGFATSVKNHIDTLLGNNAETYSTYYTTSHSKRFLKKNNVLKY